MKTALLILCAALPVCAHSQVTTYAYQGQPYDASGDAIEGFIELTQPLQSNTTVTITPTIQAFMTAAGDSRLSVPGSTFTLTTDSNGNIVGWAFDGELDWACNCATVFSSSNTGFDNVSEEKYPFPTQSFGTSITPGTWTTIAGPPMQAQQPQVAKAQSQLTAEDATAASYLVSANAYITMVLAAHAQTAVWEARAKSVAAKCGCSW